VTDPDQPLTRRAAREAENSAPEPENPTENAAENQTQQPETPVAESLVWNAPPLAVPPAAAPAEQGPVERPSDADADGAALPAPATTPGTDVPAAAPTASATETPAAPQEPAHFPPLGWHDYPSSPVHAPAETGYSLVPPPEPEATQAFSIADLQDATSPDLTPEPAPAAPSASPELSAPEATSATSVLPPAAAAFPPAPPVASPPVTSYPAPNDFETTIAPTVAPTVAPYVPIASAGVIAGADDAPDAPRQGFFSKNRRVLVPVALAVAFVVLGTGAVFAGIGAGSSSGNAGSGGGGAAADAARAVPDTIPAATAVNTCLIGSAATNDVFGDGLTLSAQSTKSGRTLYSDGGADAAAPGTAMQAVTAAAALAELGPDYTLTTKVLDNNTPGSIVLVGGGDATLSAVPAHVSSIYPGAPKLSTLAAATKKSYNAAHPDVPITEVVLDSSLWDSTDRWDPTWPRTLQTNGDLSEVTALQVDGDRQDPMTQVSPRSTDPITRAGQAFIAALGLEGVAVREGTAENGAPLLAQANSAPVSKLVSQMLKQRDGTLAEMLARTVSKKQNLDGTAASLKEAIPAALNKLDLKTDDVTVADGSGWSTTDAVPPVVMANLMTKVNTDDSLKSIASSLAVGGKSGDLATGFFGDNAVAAGDVRAIQGTSATGETLSGIITAKDNSQIAFAAYAIGETPAATPTDTDTALQTLATRLWSCGGNLVPKN